MPTFETGCKAPGTVSFPQVALERSATPSNHSRHIVLKAWDGKRASRYRGVTKRPRGWAAYMQDVRIAAGRKVFLGRFASELHAALAYDAALWVLGERPLRTRYFITPHILPLHNFICAIAQRIGKPYPPQ